MLQYVDEYCHGEWSHYWAFERKFQNFARELYIHMLVCFTTLWHCVCDNYARIVVSHYHHLFHLQSLVLQCLWNQWMFSLLNLTLRFQFGFKVMYPNFIDNDYSLQKRSSFLFVISQMFLTQFHITCLHGKQHVWYPLHCNLFLCQIFG